MFRVLKFVLPLILTGGVATAATLDASDFERIYTEGNRTRTLDGTDISGHAALPGNGDVGRLVLEALAPGDDVLLAGRIAEAFSDRFVFAPSTGRFRFDVVNYAKVTNDQFGAPFEASFGLYVGSTLVEQVSLRGETPEAMLSYRFDVLALAGQQVELEVRGIRSRSEYDISVAAVPVPAAGFLLIGGLGALGAVRRRRAA